MSVVYDRAALIALPPELRSKYVAHLKQVLPGAAQLLLTIEYPQERMDGPPFSVGLAEVRRLYGDGYEIEHRAGRDASEHFQGQPQSRGGQGCSSTRFRLKARGR